MSLKNTYEKSDVAMKIYIDDQPLEVKEGQNLLHAALSLGFDVPYFCWHEALGSVGACRQCAVIQYRDADDKKGRLVMSCMTPAVEGARISIDHPDAKSFRASVIEWLMTNHPHDCPICDEGGECHLQDMTLMTGHNYRRFRFNKRTFKNQDLGPYINHEMNRCITCYRCVRFYRDLAGGTDLNAFSSSNRVFFGRAEDGQLESEFSGNLVEICPTGVFTDKQFKQNYVRKWDLQVAPSVCQLCSLGCNITPGERGGIVRRIQNRFHSEINGYFICDKGRFGHTFVNSPDRLRKPLVRASRSSVQTETSYDDALAGLQSKILNAKATVAVASTTASLETNFALRKLVGPDNFFSPESQSQFDCVQFAHSVLQKRDLKSASLKEIEESDAVLIIGEDLTKTAPMMAFSVRQVVHHQAQKTALQLQIPKWNDAAIRNLVTEKTGPIFSLQTNVTKLDDVAEIKIQCDVSRMESIAAAIAGAHSDNLSAEDEKTARAIAEKLKGAQKPVIIAGASLESLALMKAAVQIAQALKAQIAFVLPASNSLGVHILGARSPSELKARLGNKVDLAIALHVENEKCDLTAADCIVAFDYINGPNVTRADIVLPVASFAESTGTLVNNEGRAQRFFRVFSPSEGLQDAWHLLTQIGSSYSSINDLTKEMASEIADLAGLDMHVTSSDFRICGQKIPRASSELSGRTAINANKTMHEPKPVQDPDSPYAHSMEGASAFVPASQAAVFWSPGWNSVQSLNKFQDEVGGPLKGGPSGFLLFAPRSETL